MSRKGSASLILTELIAAVIIFIVCTTVCVGLFVGADKTANASKELTGAVLAAGNAAECINFDYAKNLTELLGAVETAPDSYRVCYDGEWKMNESGTAADGGYTLDIIVTSRDGVIYAEITVKSVQSGRHVYTLCATALSEKGWQ